MRFISDTKNFIIENRLFSIVLLLSVIFLLTGSLHNYPYILHADEPTTVRTALAQRFHFGVDRFDWGHLGFYLQYFLFEILIKARVIFNLIGLEDFFRTNFNLLYQDPYIFYVIARISTQIMAVATIIVLYKILNLFFDKLTSGISVLFLVVAPYFLYHSHFAVQDPPQLFFLTLSLYFSLRKPFEESSRGLILAALFMACSASYKINSVIFIPFFYLANFILTNFNKGFVRNFVSLDNIKRIIFWTLIFGLTFFAIHYTIATKWDTFWSYEPSYGFLWQLQVNSSIRDNFGFGQAIIEIFDHINKTFSVTSGVVVLISVLFVLLMTVKQVCRKEFNSKDAVIFILTVSLIVFVALMIRSNKYRIHYLFPIFPLLILSVAYLIDKFKYLRDFKYLYLIFLIYPMYLSGVQTIKMNRLSTTALVVNEMLNDESRNYYYVSDDIHNVKLWNFIDEINPLDKKLNEVKSNDIVVSDKLIQDPGYEYLKTQDNFLRMGFTYYFYRRI